jgi:prepilin-type N-terminal cleavage/methylation domain-containing protein
LFYLDESSEACGRMGIMQWAKQHKTGFTIVELLIVIVVIAILAAITIVAYNGIQNRAKQSSAQSLVSQAQKKVMAYAVQNADRYPATLAEAEVSDPNGQLEYSVNNDVTPRTYGITATNGTFSYYVSNSVTTPTAGGYPGHGQGGAASITNYFYNPQFSGPSAPVNQTGTTPAIGSYNGSLMAQATTTSSAAVSIRLQPNTQRLAVSEGQTLYASMTVYNANTSTRNFSATIRFYDAAADGTSLGTAVSNTGSGSVAVNAGASTTLTISTTVPAGVVSAGINVNRDSTGSSVSGDVYYVDNVFFGSRPAGFADGSTPNWIWQGQPNNSPSTGPQAAI